MNAPAPPARMDVHPAPHRGRISLGSIWLGLFLAPAAWFAQLTIDTFAISRVCFPKDMPIAAPLAPVMPLVYGADILALALGLVAGLVAFTNWRKTREEMPGRGHHLIESGDGRTRFMSMSGMLVSGIVLLAVAYAGVAHLMLAGCGQ